MTYAYESISYWDKEKKQGRSKKKCIGHVDPLMRFPKWSQTHFHNGQKAADDEKVFSKKLIQLRQELEAGKRKSSHEKLYEKYFEVHQTPVRGVKIISY